MIQVPYIGSDQNACALACYTMVAKYFFPDTSFEQIAKISDWEPGYVVWGFKFWNWITKKGIQVTDYDMTDYRLWAAEGSGVLKNLMSEKEFDYVNTHTKDLEALTADLKVLMKNKKFTYHKERPTFELLKKEVSAGNPCEVVLDSHTLDRRKGFALHRVVVLAIDEEYVVFHDPRPEPRAERKETVEHFKNAWLSLESPELCIYKRE